MFGVTWIHPLLRIRFATVDRIVAVAMLLAALCVTIESAEALEATANRADSGWCTERAGSGEPASCIYSNFVTCGIAAIAIDGSCKSRSSLQARPIEKKPRMRAIQDHAASLSISARSGSSHRSALPSTVSIAEREKLFREFVEWRRQRSDH